MKKNSFVDNEKNAKINYRNDSPHNFYRINAVHSKSVF